MTNAAESTKSLGIAACTAIVGNMVGSGFYLSPSAVAPYGTLAIAVWALMGVGAISLGLTFAKLARLRPETGGPYAYTRIAYGDFPGFLIAWVYWISIWASLPVIAVAFAGAFIDMFPGLHSRLVATVLTLGAILAVVLITLRGVKDAGLFAAPHGPGAHGGSARWSVPADLLKTIGAGRARDRHYRLGEPDHDSRLDP